MVDPNFVAYTQGVATPLWRQIPDSLLRTRGLLAAPAACARPHDVGWPLCFFLCVSGSASVCARVCVGWGGAALVTGLLCVDPAQRLTIQQVRRHAWFTEYACRRARAALPRRADGPRTRAHAASYDRAPVIWGIQALLALGCWYRVFCFFSLAPSRRSSPRAWTRPPPPSEGTYARRRPSVPGSRSARDRAVRLARSRRPRPDLVRVARGALVVGLAPVVFDGLTRARPSNAQRSASLVVAARLGL